MKSKLLGTIVAGALAGVLVSGTAMADDKKKAGAKGKGAAKAAAGKCEHTCKGLASCAADGSTCAGQNACGGKGKVNPKCEAAKDKKACGEVKGDDAKAICKWK